ncbi:nucleotidyltransferase [Bosea sp. NPDC055353]
MTENEYLQNILARERVDVSSTSPLRGYAGVILPHLRAWAGDHIREVSPSGSFAKGTAVKSGTDIDLFISLSHTLTATLENIYTTLFNRMNQAGFKARRQNVSIGVRVDGHDVDLVPARRQDGQSQDHSLYRNRRGGWTKTNIATHINLVGNSGRTEEIRILKLWRNQKGLHIPSFYLELLAIDALYDKRAGDVGRNVMAALAHIRDNIGAARIVDPANTNNIISEDLSAAEKTTIAKAAGAAAQAATWGEIVR